LISVLFKYPFYWLSAVDKKRLTFVSVVTLEIPFVIFIKAGQSTNSVKLHILFIKSSLRQDSLSTPFSNISNLIPSK